MGILIVDDNAADRELCLIALEELGRTEDVGIAENARDALAVLKAVEDPTLVLLDIKMPGMDGHELLEALGDREPVSVVMLTSSAWSEDRARALAHPRVLSYLTKPPAPAELRRLLDSI